MLDQLSERLQGALQGLDGGRAQVTEEDLDQAFREIRRALLEADVNMRVLKAFISRVKERALGDEVLKKLNPTQHLVGLVHEELIALLGKENQPLNLPGQPGEPSLLVLFGLQGSGKTTTAGKLARKLKKAGKNPLLVAADTYRPAAIQQLITLGKQVGIPVHHLPGSTDMLAIAKTGVDTAKANQHDVVLIDTAGRLQVDTDLMAELLLLERAFAPQEKLLVIDAMMGQEAVATAEAFDTQLGVTGLVISKLDGDARGGAVLSVVEATGKPIKLIGAGEAMDALEDFHPERMASRILGMGDVLSLVEKAQQAIDLEEAKAMEAKLRQKSFSLDDFMKIQKQLRMLGGLENILGMLPIPGMNKEMREMLAHGGETQMKRIQAMIHSMTAAERDTPELINSSRRARIAKGCGLPDSEIKQFLTQFEQMRTLMKHLTGMTDDLKQGKQPSLPGMGGRSPGFPGSGKGMNLQMPRAKGKKKQKHSSGSPFPFPGGGGSGGGFPKFPF